MPRNFHSPDRTFIAVLVMACAFFAAACDVDGGSGKVTGVITPSPVDDLIATITTSPFIQTPAAGLPCVFPSASLAFNVAITASRTVNVNQVTLRLNDGTNVGPSVTFPSPLLTQRFETTVVPAGGTRVLAFDPPFGCIALPGNIIFADIFLTDGSGSERTITTSTSLH